MNKSLINEQMLTTTLYINTGSLNKDIDNVISDKLQEKVGDICNISGYILKRSIKIIKRSIGEITTSNGLSHVKYIVTYKCDVLVPCQGDIIEGFVHRINKLGVISYIKLGKKDVEKFEDSPLISVTPTEYFENSSFNMDDINVGQRIKLKIVGVRTKYNSDKIQVVSTPL
tara:strand:- start:6397 stop:6909 length:513 start_codon:yes stop_codon:yes gene_type:complete